MTPNVYHALNYGNIGQNRDRPRGKDESDLADHTPYSQSDNALGSLHKADLALLSESLRSGSNVTDHQ